MIRASLKSANRVFVKERAFIEFFLFYSIFKFLLELHKITLQII